MSGFLVHGDYLYYFKKNDYVLYVSSLDNLSEAKIVSTMPNDFDTQSPARIIKSSDNTYLILSWSGELYFISKINKVTFINSRVENAYFTNYNERIVYYNNNEIWIYYIKEKLSRLYYNAGIQTPKELCKWEAESLHKHFEEFVRRTNWDGAVPFLSDLQGNIERAKKLPSIVEYE